MRQTLSHDDVVRLLKDPSGENRREAAVKISSTYGAEDLTDEERNIAEDILRALAKDVETSVREALAENLKEYSGLAHDLAVTMASDVNSVALPIIQFSDVLSDDDLLDIVRTQGTEKQNAVAQRATVSEEVADALVETGKEEVVATLVGNDGASISDKTFDKVLNDFSKSDLVKTNMVGRSQLPVAVSERLVHLVSEKLQEQLVAKHSLPPDVATDLIIQSRERATLGLLSPEANIMDVQALVSQLNENGRLTPSIILRSLCMGDMEFFEVSVAVLSGLPLGAARALIHDEGSLGLPAIIEKAGLPEGLRPIFKAAVEVANETDYDGGENDRERFRARMLERILTHMEDPSDGMGSENAEYLLERLVGIGISTATQSWSIH
ncbi:MAG: DUF2336 domain-containing protein [Rhodospirillaceae bacterium]|jgi:uncharacterized protein (DUF2336 family)|nr:DUF2336 domain-containing protein [Rhodospirillaceae bacterium]MBT5458021.1 DUF2336 domain-containing protein [Rhodospirillaceae bacterium]